MGLSDLDAHCMTKFEHSLVHLALKEGLEGKRLHGDSLAAMTGQARYTSAEKELLLKELLILKSQLEPLTELKDICKDRGIISARRWRNAYAAIILA